MPETLCVLSIVGAFIWGFTAGCVFMTVAGLWYARRYKKKKQLETKEERRK